MYCYCVSVVIRIVVFGVIVNHIVVTGGVVAIAVVGIV